MGIYNYLEFYQMEIIHLFKRTVQYLDAFRATKFCILQSFAFPSVVHLCV